MKKEFIKRVIREEVVDTKKYRYVIKWKYFGTCGIIKRIPLKCLGTTAVLDDDNWEFITMIQKKVRVSPDFLLMAQTSQHQYAETEEAIPA